METTLNDKQRVAKYAADLIQDGMTVGLGTGSTANYFIDELARKQRELGTSFRCVSSSVVSANKARESGLEVVSIENIASLDVYVDGADEVTSDFCLLKGRGFDLVKEKLLAHAAERFVVLIDSSKRVDFIGQNYPIPVEVMPFAWQMVKTSLEKLGGNVVLRQNSAGDGLAITSHGSLVLDVRFASDVNVTELNQLLSFIPGIVEHGIFEGLASDIFVGENNTVTAL
jgi:ribose 5-phosphate isomerase A